MASLRSILPSPFRSPRKTGGGFPVEEPPGVLTASLMIATVSWMFSFPSLLTSPRGSEGRIDVDGIAHSELQREGGVFEIDAAVTVQVPENRDGGGGAQGHSGPK